MCNVIGMIIMYVNRCFYNKLSKLKVIKSNSCSTIAYVQGQSPEKRIREYFYYIDHQGMVGKYCYI